MDSQSSDQQILLSPNDNNNDNDSDIELGYNHNHRKPNQYDKLPIDETDDIDHKPFLNNVRAYAWHLRQSVSFFIIYLTLIILNATVLVLEFTSGKYRILCIILEGIITVLFVCEVIVQIITEECDIYWKSWLNRIDFIVCILCVFLFVLWASFEEAPHSHHLIDSFMDAVLVGVRYGLQAIRLLRFAHKGHENKKMLENESIEFEDKLTNTILKESGIVIKHYNNHDSSKLKNRKYKNKNKNNKKNSSNIELIALNNNDSEENEYDSNSVEEDSDITPKNSNKDNNKIDPLTDGEKHGELRNIANVSDLDSPIKPKDDEMKKKKKIDVNDYKLNEIDINFENFGMTMAKENILDEGGNDIDIDIENDVDLNKIINGNDKVSVDRLEMEIDPERMEMYKKMTNENIYSSAN